MVILNVRLIPKKSEPNEGFREMFSKCSPFSQHAQNNRRHKLLVNNKSLRQQVTIPQHTGRKTQQTYTYKLLMHFDHGISRTTRCP